MWRSATMVTAVLVVVVVATVVGFVACENVRRLPGRVPIPEGLTGAPVTRPQPRPLPVVNVRPLAGRTPGGLPVGVSQLAPGTPQGGPTSCPAGLEFLTTHVLFSGREYHFSWCNDPRRKFSFQEAQDYCERLASGGSVGFRAVSIESQIEDAFISSKIRQYLVPYVWTSGRRVSNGWMWQSGVASQYSNWSNTGSSNRPQPDNRDGNENCVAVLNNFYHDGIRWHDIDCSLSKYAICERPSESLGLRGGRGRGNN